MLKSAMGLMVEKLGEGDHVKIGARRVGLQLPPQTAKEGRHQRRDRQAGAGGAINGSAGILLAYETAIRISSGRNQSRHSWRPMAISTLESPIRRLDPHHRRKQRAACF
jgi:hypothetical protein